jgi:hypothetical protein
MTLGDYLRVTALLFGEGSPPHKFIAGKIASNPRGEDDEVVADISQMVMLFVALMEKKVQ